MREFNKLSVETIRKISALKKEPSWMLDFRLQALEVFKKLSLPEFEPNVNLLDLDLEEIDYYVEPKAKKQRTWVGVPDEIKDTFYKLGIPQAEQSILAGVEAQFDSEAIYGSLQKKLEQQGVIFTNIETALQKHPWLLQKYFGTLVKVTDNKFSALNSAVWSGGSFLYVPPGVKVDLPLQAYFQMGAPGLGQFERTLIIADTNSSVFYVEGCTAPTYSENSLHAGVVEIFVGKNATVRYTTIQNWSKNVYNLVTKKALVDDSGNMIWVDGNLGSKVTMKYPACYLKGNHANGEMYSVSLAAKGQEISSGARMIHIGQDTTSKVISKSLVDEGGKNVYRGDLRVEPLALRARSHLQCQSLILDKSAISGSFPSLKVEEPTAIVTHEAFASRLEEEKLNYLKTRGLTEDESRDLMIKGFVSEVVNELPIEYALEFNKLLEKGTL